MANRSFERLWIAAMKNGSVWTSLVVENQPFSWDSQPQLVVYFRMDTPGCSLAEAVLFDPIRGRVIEAKQLLFHSNNTIGDFKVRVYRTEVSAQQARVDFGKQVDPCRPQGMA